MIITKIIEVNKLACDNIKGIEAAILDCEIKNDKDKANFGNLCIALKGFRMVAEATEALLVNENILKTDDGDFYQKVEMLEVPSTEGQPGSDYDKDKDIQGKKQKDE